MFPNHPKYFRNETEARLALNEVVDNLEPNEKLDFYERMLVVYLLVQSKLAFNTNSQEIKAHIIEQRRKANNLRTYIKPESMTEKEK